MAKSVRVEAPMVYVPLVGGGVRYAYRGDVLAAAAVDADWLGRNEAAGLVVAEAQEAEAQEAEAPKKVPGR